MISKTVGRTARALACLLGNVTKILGRAGIAVLADLIDRGRFSSFHDDVAKRTRVDAARVAPELYLHDIEPDVRHEANVYYLSLIHI